MMYVADEDLDLVSASREVTCESCDAVYKPTDVQHALMYGIMPTDKPLALPADGQRWDSARDLRAEYDSRNCWSEAIHTLV